MGFTELSEFDFYPRISATSGIAIVILGLHYGACQWLEKQLPEWLSGRVAHLFKVDVERCTALARAFDVFHLPALFVFVNGHYHGPLHAEAAARPMITALEKLLSEPAHEEP